MSYSLSYLTSSPYVDMPSDEDSVDVSNIPADGTTAFLSHHQSIQKAVAVESKDLSLAGSEGHRSLYSSSDEERMVHRGNAP